MTGSTMTWATARDGGLRGVVELPHLEVFAVGGAPGMAARHAVIELDDGRVALCVGLFGVEVTGGPDPSPAPLQILHSLRRGVVVVVDPRDGGLEVHDRDGCPPLRVGLDGPVSVLGPAAPEADELVLLFDAGARSEQVARALPAAVQGELPDTDRVTEELCHQVLRSPAAAEAGGELVLLAVRRTPPPQPFGVSGRTTSASLGHIRGEARDWLTEAGVGLIDRIAVDAVLRELCRNCSQHAYPTGTDGPVHVALALTAGVLRTSVTDEGRWRSDPEIVSRHRGLQLARAVSDSLDVRTGPDGTTVTATHRITRPGGPPLPPRRAAGGW